MINDREQLIPRCFKRMVKIFVAGCVTAILISSTNNYCISQAITTNSKLSTVLRLPRFISDNMVLQRDRQIAIWGWAGSGQNVTVNIGT